MSILKFTYCLDKTFSVCMFTQQEKITTQIGEICKYTRYKYRLGRTNIYNNKQNTRKKNKTELIDYIILFFFENVFNLLKHDTIILINK